MFCAILRCTVVSIICVIFCIVSFPEKYYFSPTIPDTFKTKAGIDLTMAAFYPCYNQPYATEQVLRFYRHSYPLSPIYMFNDGGMQILKYLAHKYNAKYFSHKHRTSHNKYSLGTHWNSSSMGKQYLHDLLYTAKDSKCDWIMLLEDDVFVLSPLFIPDLICDIMGRNPDPMSISLQNKEENKVQKYLKSLQITTHTFNNGNGGSVLRGSFLRNISFKSVDHAIDLFYNLSCYMKSPCTVASDQVVFFMVQVHNGSAGTYQHYAYHWWPTNWLMGPLGYIHITHGDKTYYYYMS